MQQWHRFLLSGAAAAALAACTSPGTGERSPSSLLPPARPSVHAMDNGGGIPGGTPIALPSTTPMPADNGGGIPGG